LCLRKAEGTDVYMLTQQKHPLFQEKRCQNVAHSETPLEGGVHNYTKPDTYATQKNVGNRHIMEIEESEIVLV